MSDSEVDFKNRKRVKNLNRLIRVRNIIKNKEDYQSDYIVISNLKKFRDEKQKIQLGLVMKKETLGLPSFIKKKFRKETEDKFKTVTGKFFGVNL